MASFLDAAGVTVEIRSTLGGARLGGGGGGSAGAGPTTGAPAAPGIFAGLRRALDPERLLMPSVVVTAGGFEAVRWEPHGRPPAWAPAAVWTALAVAVVGLFGATYALGARAGSRRR